MHKPKICKWHRGTGDNEGVGSRSTIPAATARERGSVTVLVLALVSLFCVVAVAMTKVSVAEIGAAKAQVAADAAVLAGAIGGGESATRLAQINGGKLLRFSQGDTRSDAEVEYGPDGVVREASADSDSDEHRVITIQYWVNRR